MLSLKTALDSLQAILDSAPKAMEDCRSSGIASVSASGAITIAAAALLYGLAWAHFRAPDHSAYDAPLPALMKEPEDISEEHENVVLKKVAELQEALKSVGVFSDAAAMRKPFEDFFFKEQCLKTSWKELK